jgi:hypothetical protein
MHLDHLVMLTLARLTLTLTLMLMPMPMPTTWEGRPSAGGESGSS